MTKYKYKVVDHNRESIIVRDLKFILKYEKGSIIKGKDDSLGVFCFKTKRDATHFANNFTTSRILRVVPLKRGKSPKK